MEEEHYLRRGRGRGIMIYEWIEFIKETCREIRHLFRALTCKRVAYYRGLRWCDNEHNYRCVWDMCEKRNRERIENE